MDTPSNPEPTEREQLDQLRSLMIKRMLEKAADPDIKASGLAVIARFLSEAGVAVPPAAPKPMPATKLPFASSEPAEQAQPQRPQPWDKLGTLRYRSDD